MITDEWINQTGARTREMSVHLSNALYVATRKIFGDIGVLCLNFTDEGTSVYMETPGKWDVLVVEHNESKRANERFAGSTGYRTRGNPSDGLVINQDPGPDPFPTIIATGSGGLGLQLGIHSITSDADSEETFRKQNTDLGCELEKACIITFRNTQSFKDWLNMCRKGNKYKGLFCNEGEVGQIAYPEGEAQNLQDVKGVEEIVVGDDASNYAYINYYTLYDLLYSRRSRDMGIAGYCESINIPFSVELVGITTCNRMYIEMNIDGVAVVMIATSPFGAPAIEQSVPASKGIRRRNRATKVVTTETTVPSNTVEEQEEVMKAELTPEQEERLDAWREAHYERCQARGVAPSDVRQNWFNDYIMSLVLQGQSPDELDDSIIKAL